MVGAVEPHLERIGLDARFLQYVLEAHAAPYRIAHRADAPFHAGHVRLEEPAPDARALADRGDLRPLEFGFQLLTGQFYLALSTLAAVAEGPVRPRELRN